MSPQEVAVLLQEYGSSRGQIDAEAALDTNALGQQRTELLAAILSSCRDLWSTGSEELDLIAEKLGDGSRDVAWRLPFGESGVLDFFVTLLAHDHLRQKLHIHALRLIGNSCADTNENRARLVDQDRLLSITKHVADESLLPFNVPVLYNILVDYEPAQSLASKTCLSKQLIHLLSLPHISKYAPFVPYVCKILALLVAQDGEAAAADPATVRVLLTLADQPAAKDDVEDFVGLASVAVAYLASEALQSRLIADDQVSLLMRVFHHAHVGLDTDAIDDEDLVAQVKQLRSSLLSTLADVSGNDSFALAYPLAHDVPQTLLEWVRGNNLFLQSAACLALGNISRSDAASIALVEGHRAHEPLVKLVADANVTDSQLLHAACSFLKNLAIPLVNKPQLKDLLLPQGVPRLYTLDAVPQLQFAAASLTRLLLLNCPANVWQICTPLVRQDKTPSSATSDAHEHTSASSIIALYRRSDAEPIQLEAARCVAAICRALHSTPVCDKLPEASSVVGTESSPPSPSPRYSDEERRMQAFYAAHAVQMPLKFLITQDKWPSLKSEAWFVLALMSRSNDGARLVLSLLVDDAAVRASLKQTIMGEHSSEEKEEEEEVNNQDDAVEQQQREETSSSVADSVAQATFAAPDLRLDPRSMDTEQKAKMARVDAENALILCTELVKHGQHTITAEMLVLLQDMVREGARRAVADRTRAHD
ncbi:hypothetical protein E4U43_001094 [Claviceps pusilla]|uniref:Uncharacterized protein n=1 Tax=Claviceps pusilla TaxID=123648 RepID=A0A9P7SZK9_9HYPO|nr:hypothetical protein E4U43_001094 [Claviceps pusilla]